MGGSSSCQSYHKESLQLWSKMWDSSFQDVVYSFTTAAICFTEQLRTIWPPKISFPEIQPLGIKCITKWCSGCVSHSIFCSFRAITILSFSFPDWRSFWAAAWFQKCACYWIQVKFPSWFTPGSRKLHYESITHVNFDAFWGFFLGHRRI